MLDDVEGLRTEFGDDTPRERRPDALDRSRRKIPKDRRGICGQILFKLLDAELPPVLRAEAPASVERQRVSDRNEGERTERGDDLVAKRVVLLLGRRLVRAPLDGVFVDTEVTDRKAGFVARKDDPLDRPRETHESRRVLYSVRCFRSSVAHRVASFPFLVYRPNPSRPRSVY